MATPNAPESGTRRGWLAPAATIGLVMVAITLLLVWLAEATRERIQANQQSGLAAGLDALMPRGSYDNDLI